MYKQRKKTIGHWCRVEMANIGQHYCLRWNNYQSNMTSVFYQLLRTEAFVDVTLTCNENSLKAHKVSALYSLWNHKSINSFCVVGGGVEGLHTLICLEISCANVWLSGGSEDLLFVNFKSFSGLPPLPVLKICSLSSCSMAQC